MRKLFFLLILNVNILCSQTAFFKEVYDKTTPGCLPFLYSSQTKESFSKYIDMDYDSMYKYCIHLGTRHLAEKVKYKSGILPTLSSMAKIKIHNYHILLLINKDAKYERFNVLTLDSNFNFVNRNALFLSDIYSDIFNIDSTQFLIDSNLFIFDLTHTSKLSRSILYITNYNIDGYDKDLCGQINLVNSNNEFIRADTLISYENFYYKDCLYGNNNIKSFTPSPYNVSLKHIAFAEYSNSLKSIINFNNCDLLYLFELKEGGSLLFLKLKHKNLSQSSYYIVRVDKKDLKILLKFNYDRSIKNRLKVNGTELIFQDLNSKKLVFDITR